jgi:hypothetical protein
MLFAANLGLNHPDTETLYSRTLWTLDVKIVKRGRNKSRSTVMHEQAEKAQ